VELIKLGLALCNRLQLTDYRAREAAHQRNLHESDAVYAYDAYVSDVHQTLQIASV
jgi:hypothetical protein